MNLEEIVRYNSINFTIIASGVLLLLVTLSVMMRKKTEFVKRVLFWTIVLVIVLNTGYLAGSTIYLNQKSATGGPIHYHADFEIWDCGTEINLVDPIGWSNKVGTPVIHEHNDKRIHVEGVILENREASLGHFFSVVGGSLSKNQLVIPTSEGIKTLKNGSFCPNGKSATLQVFIYKTVGNIYTQQKIDNPSDYSISPYSAVPPADCIIIEYDSDVRDKTDKLCQSYKVAKLTGKIHAAN